MIATVAAAPGLCWTGRERAAAAAAVLLLRIVGGNDVTTADQRRGHVASSTRVRGAAGE